MADMMKLMFCLRRRTDVEPEEFTRYWADNHARLVSSVADDLGVVRYVQCHTVHGEQTDLIRASRGCGPPFDGVAEVWMDAAGLGDEMAAATIDASLKLLEDEQRFIDLPNSVVFWTREIEVIPS